MIIFDEIIDLDKRTVSVYCDMCDNRVAIEIPEWITYLIDARKLLKNHADCVGWLFFDEVRGVNVRELCRKCASGSKHLTGVGV